LEEIVGEIRDEFDTEERKEVEMVNDGHLIVDGKISLAHVRELLRVELESDDHDTIGGWLYSINPELKKGMEWRYRDLTIIVLEKEKHRIRKLEIIKQG